MKNEEYRDRKFKGGACSDPVRSRANSKDTKRWCRGVVGREHVKRWTAENAPYSLKNWWDLVCTECGKKFDYCTIFFKGDKCKCGNHAADTPPTVR